MRSSDWSSDVCSSDLVAAVDAVARAERVEAVFRAGMELARHLHRAAHARHVERGAAGAREFSVDETKIKGGVVRDERRIAEEFDQLVDARRGCVSRRDEACARSEAHTSELQSPMRTPYSVFCFEKNKH